MSKSGKVESIKKEPLNGQKKFIVIKLTIKEQREIVALL
jgi:hypothetical protein